MKTRIDHATILTQRDGDVAILEDASVAWDDGIITAIGPGGHRETQAKTSTVWPELAEVRGRPLGRVFLEMGEITPAQLDDALEHQKTHPSMIGQTLMERGHVSGEAVEAALDLQAGRLPRVGDVQVIDGRNRIVIPGLVNTHHHLFQSLTRGMKSVQNATLFEWLTRQYPVWRHMDYAACRDAAVISLAELLLGGATTTSDHMYLFPDESDVKIEAVLEAAELLGIRIHACRGSMSMGQSAGGLPPDSCTQDEDAILRDCRRAVEAYHDPRPHAMCRIDLAPCAPFSISPELFDATRDLARDKNVLLHTHAAETLDEERYCLERYGMRPMMYLHEHGWLAGNVYLAHCVCLNAEEIELLARTHTGVAHCPCSNMRLASGIAPIRAMLDAGVKVGLGVDGSSSNDGGNLLAEGRQALLLQRVSGNPQGLTPEEAFRLLTAGGASVLNRDELGKLDIGMAADMVMYDARDVAFAGAMAQDPLAALMLCHAPRPQRVIIAGHTVVDEGRIVRMDMDSRVADFNAMVARRFRPSSTS